MANCNVVVKMVRGLGHDIPAIFFKKYGAKYEGGFHDSQDSHWEAQAGNFSVYEVPVQAVFPTSFMREYCGIRTEFVEEELPLLLMKDGVYVFSNGQEITPVQAKGLLEGSLIWVKFWATNDVVFFRPKDGKEIMEKRIREG